ncbi:MAG: hypothetical protein LBI14_00115 [Treponema sp.]|jgi:hypothetical protein|nr:hypothetical protein [Treponema sp.]
MRKNLSALFKRSLGPLRLFLLASLVGSFPLKAQEVQNTLQPSLRWYRSNASGMALEYIPSGIVALENEYSLSVVSISSRELPSFLLPLYDPVFFVELRVLYHNKEPYRQQWIFRDQRGITRVNASGEFGQNPGLEKSGFIDVYDEAHSLISERRFIEGAEIVTFYDYSEGLLIKAETWTYVSGQISSASINRNNMKDPPNIIDYYRYTRSFSLRAIERVFNQGYDESQMDRLTFPAIIPGISREPEFQNPGLALSTEFLDDVITAPLGRIIYTTDSRGRVLVETMLDENGEVIGELRNSWTGDRLDSVLWKSGDDERLTEYEYDSNGDRILERNINNGVLERTVRTTGNRDIEELYMDGRVVLRAVWEDGRKISEERIR